MEAWLSGLKRHPAKMSTGKPVRRFESFRLRSDHKTTPCGVVLWRYDARKESERERGRETIVVSLGGITQTEGFESASAAGGEQ